MRRCRRFVFEDFDEENEDIEACNLLMIMKNMLLVMMIAVQTARWSRSVCSVVKPLLHRFPYLAPIMYNIAIYKGTQNLYTIRIGANKF